MNDSLIIQGPQGCGKSVNAEALAKHFGLGNIVELDEQKDVRPQLKGTLYLTNKPVRANKVRAMPFWQAMKEAGLAASGTKAQPTLIHVPLDRLVLSPRNARKTGGGDVDNIVSSIAAHGLLQNLTITAPAAEGNAYEVVAGGRRLAALKQLAREERLPAELADDGIPCRLITVDVALEASTAENTLREAMHPADQCDAFKAMIEAGETITDVAAHFGVPEIVVKQRLKLANVNPKLVAIYREGGMNLDQLQALAITDNHELQRQAWYTAKGDWERDPRNLREFLTRQEVEASRSPLALFVGLDAYVEAGGQVRRDLFSDRAWLCDPQLLDTLAMDKLEVVAATERADGWSWAEAHLQLDYAGKSEYPDAMADRLVESRYASAEDEKRVPEIEASMAAIDRGDVEDERYGGEEYQRLEAEWDAIEARRIEQWPDAIKAASGALVTLDHRGNVEVLRGRLQPGQKVDRKSGAVTGTPKAEKPDKPKPATLSAAVHMNLSAHRSEVAKYHVMRDPQLALALLVDAMLGQQSHRNGGDAGVLRVNFQRGRDVSQGIAADVHRMLRSTDDLPEACRLKIPGGEKRLPWLIKQPQASLLQIMAGALGASIDGVTENDRGHRGIAVLHEAIGFNMADHWNPTCDDFLARIPKPLALEAVREAKSAEQAKAIEGLKKADLVAEAGKLLAGTGWLPKPLRGANYGAKAPAKGKAKKATKKKPALKKVILNPKVQVKEKPARKAAAAKKGS